MGKTKIKDQSEPIVEEKKVEEAATEQVEASEPEKKESTAKKQKASKQSKTKKEIKHSKKYFEAAEQVDKGRKYSIPEAVEMAQKTSYTKFDGTLEIHVSTNVKNLRGLVQLPFASGKKLKIIAFGKGAEDSGADLVGDDKALEEIMKGRVGFDALIATPDWMPRLARAAKVLGPRGLMPNPKNNTVTTDLKKAVDELQSGRTEYKSEKNLPVIHLGLGKLSQPGEELTQNIKVLLTTIGKSKVKKAAITATMGPSIKIDTSSL